MDIEVLWERVRACEGQIFKQIRGGEFSFEVKGNYIVLSRTNRSVSKATFKQALKKMPL